MSQEEIAEVLYQKLNGDFVGLSNKQIAAKFPHLKNLRRYLDNLNPSRMNHREDALDAPCEPSDFFTVPARSSESGDIQNEYIQQLLESDPTLPSDFAEHAKRTGDRTKRLIAGETLAKRFRVESEIGRGGTSTVYRAREIGSDELVAVKCYQLRNANEADFLLSELESTKRVRHPNVCRVYSLQKHNEMLFLVMEYIEGQSLAALLTMAECLSPITALKLAGQLFSALDAIHANNVVHGDLKPSNIMISREGVPTIIDFGVAKLSDQSRQPGVGTPLYMAPEQFQGLPATTQSDIYSLALTLYEAVTGKIDAGRAFNFGAHEIPTAARNFDERIDARLERVLTKCLNPSPECRPPTAADVLQLLGAGNSPQKQKRKLSPASIGLYACFLAGLLGCILTSGSRYVERLNLKQDSLVDFVSDRGEQISSVLGQRRPESNFEELGTLRYLPFENNPGGDLESVNFWFRKSRGPDNFDRLMFRPDVAPRQSRYDRHVKPETECIRIDTSGRLVEFVWHPTMRTDNAMHLKELRFFEAIRQAQSRPEEFAKLDNCHADVPTVWDDKQSWESVEHKVDVAFFGDNLTYFFIQPKRPGLVRSGSNPLTRFLRPSVFLVALLILLDKPMTWRRDKRAGARLTIFVGATSFLAWIFADNDLLLRLSDTSYIQMAFANAVLVSASILFLYLAVEPFLRKHDPQSMVGWNSLMHGILDRRVAFDILWGCSTTVMLVVIFELLAKLLVHLGFPERFVLPYPPTLDPLLFECSTISMLLLGLTSGVFFGLFLTVMPTGIHRAIQLVSKKLGFRAKPRWLFASRALAYLIIWLLITSYLNDRYGPISESPPPDAFIFWGILAAWTLFLLTISWFKGLLATVVTTTTLFVLVGCPITRDISRPYFTSGMFCVVFLLCLATTGLWLANRKASYFLESE